MEDIHKHKKDTDTEGFGTPRSDVEGIVEQAPSTSLSGDCEQDKSTSRGDLATEDTGKMEHKKHGEIKEQEIYTFLSASERENLDTSEWLPFPTSRHISGVK